MKKTKIIPNGIDDFWLENLYTDKDFTKYDDVFLYVGKINPTSDNDAKSYILNQALYQLHF